MQSLLNSTAHSPEEARNPLLQVSHISKTYGSGETAVHALADIDFTVNEGEFVCIVGPSGAGKTTLLRCLAGLMQPTSGTASLAGNVIDGPPEGLGMVFQDYGRSLMPWLKIISNVEFPLRNKGVPKDERRQQSLQALEAVGLAGFEQKRPYQLSGGMQQRAAIARALAYQPKLLLMDEPFASVDAQTRSDLEDLTLNIQRSSGVTTLFVTHDIDEAVYLADRVVVLSKPPTRVATTFEIDLPRQRDQFSTKELPNYAHLRNEILRAVRAL